jgi:ribosomal protein S3
MVLSVGYLGVQVKIMKGWDATGKEGPKKPMPDVVTIHQPKDEDFYAQDKTFGKEKEGYVKDFVEPALPVQPQPV